MNAQVTFKLNMFNLETELSAEALGERIESEIKPMIHQIIKAVVQNESWILELETRLKEGIPISETAKQVFEANNISVGEGE